MSELNPKNRNRREFLRRLSILVVGALFCFTLDSVAETGSGDPQTKWDSLPESEKQKLLTRWEEFKAMPPKEQADIRSALERFKKLSEAQKALVKENFDHWKTLSPEQQAEIRKKFAAWKDLPESEKEILRGQRSKALDKDVVPAH